MVVLHAIIPVLRGIYGNKNGRFKPVSEAWNRDHRNRI